MKFYTTISAGITAYKGPKIVTDLVLYEVRLDNAMPSKHLFGNYWKLRQNHNVSNLQCSKMSSHRH